MTEQDAVGLDMTAGELLPQSRGPRTMVFQKDINPVSIGRERYDLAVALRELGQRIGVSLSRYAARVPWDRSTLSRFFSGALVPSADFVDQLISDGDRHLGVELTPAARDLVRRLHRESQRVASPTTADLQNLRDELTEAERQNGLLQQEARLLRNMVQAAYEQMEERQDKLRMLERCSAADRLTHRAELVRWSEDYGAVRTERDQLQELLGKLKNELADAERRAAEAEERCSALEDRLEAAEEAAAEEKGSFSDRFIEDLEILAEISEPEGDPRRYWASIADMEPPIEQSWSGEDTGPTTSPSPSFLVTAPSSAYQASKDVEVRSVVRELEGLDPSGKRTTSVLAGATDKVTDGARTGRLLLVQLSTVERSSLQAITANLLQHEFTFPDGRSGDFLIAGLQVRFHFSVGPGWSFPPSATNQICLLIQVNENAGHWSMGVVRATPEHLHAQRNTDGKRRLSAAGRSAIHWLHHEAELQTSVLTRIPAASLEAITLERSSQLRIHQLFLTVQHQLISLRDLTAVARQPDVLRRVRASRVRLANEGVLVLGPYEGDQQLARDLHLPVPGPGQWVAARLVRMRSNHGTVPSALLAGDRWCVAHAEDSVEPLPPRLR